MPRLTDEQRAALANTMSAAWGDNPCIEFDPQCPECIARAAYAAALALCDELDALREQLDAAQTALVDAETVKRERDALRAKLAEAERLLWECLAADNLPVEAECGLPCELAASIKAYLAGVQHG